MMSAASATERVVLLHDDSFESTVVPAAGDAWFVAFMAPWCPHCKSFAPVWEDEIAAELVDDDGAAAAGVRIARVDVKASKETAGKFVFATFPTVKLFADGFVYDYTGSRDSKDIVAFARGGYKSAAGRPYPPDKFPLR